MDLTIRHPDPIAGLTGQGFEAETWPWTQGARKLARTERGAWSVEGRAGALGRWAPGPLGSSTAGAGHVWSQALPVSDARGGWRSRCRVQIQRARAQQGHPSPYAGGVPQNELGSSESYSDPGPGCPLNSALPCNVQLAFVAYVVQLRESEAPRCADVRRGRPLAGHSLCSIAGSRV